MDLECDICTERFDGAERLPKVLPCGHTACLQCLRRLPDSRCPTCRRDRAASRDPSPAAAPTPPAAAPTPPAAAATPAAAPPATHEPPPAEALPPREMDVSSISYSGPNYNQQEKAAVLREAQGVTRLVNVRCHRDPAWSLQLLQRAAPTLEQVVVHCPREAHLHAVHAMPRLRMLAVQGDDALLAQPPELAALPPGHAGLQLLKVWDLPRATTESLLQAHGGTLEELELDVGTAGSDEWPESCGDLHSMLQQSGLRALKMLVLRRGWFHEPDACRDQLAKVRRVLAGAEVLCRTCDGLRLGEW